MIELGHRSKSSRQECFPIMYFIKILHRNLLLWKAIYLYAVWVWDNKNYIDSSDGCTTMWMNILNGNEIDT